jgi:flagellar basal body-associated protein FliL
MGSRCAVRVIMGEKPCKENRQMLIIIIIIIIITVVVVVVIIIIRISHFSALAGKYSPILGCIINRIRLGGLMCNLGNFLQLNMY